MFSYILTEVFLKYVILMLSLYDLDISHIISRILHFQCINTLLVLQLIWSLSPLCDKRSGRWQ